MHSRWRTRRTGGFTLVELMISLVIFSIAVAGMLSVAVTMANGYRSTRAAISAENAVRVPIDFLADAARQISPGVQSGQIEDTMGPAGACTVAALTVTSPGAGPDTLDMIYAAGAVVTSTQSIYDGVTTTLDVSDASALVAGDFLIITDINTGHLVQIASVAGNSLTLEAPTCTLALLPAAGYPGGSIVVRARHAIVSVGVVDGVPTLLFDPDAGGPLGPEPLAEGVEDFQVAVGIDTTGTVGVLDENLGGGGVGDDWIGNAAGETVALSSALRALRITLVARTNDAIGEDIYFRPAVEDRSAGGMDRFRRRILRTSVELRNFGGSP